MRAAIIQSNYIPWKGYFDLINDVDVFVFYETAQYTVRDWRNRNLIKTDLGAKWLSVPVGNDRSRLINEVFIRNESWQLEHFKTIQHFYKKAKYYKLFEEFLYDFYVERSWSSLSDLNRYLIQKISIDFLGIKTKFLNSSDLSKIGSGQDAILSLLKDIGADVYISGPAAKSYLEESKFKCVGIDLIWKEYGPYKNYEQFYPPFLHNVSILDLLFHCGPNSSFHCFSGNDL